MKISTDFGLEKIKCVVCGEEMFLDHKGKYYICMKSCQRIKKERDRNEGLEQHGI